MHMCTREKHAESKKNFKIEGDISVYSLKVAEHLQSECNITFTLIVRENSIRMNFKYVQ